MRPASDFIYIQLSNSRAVWHNGMVKKGKQKLSLKQYLNCPCSSAPGTIQSGHGMKQAGNRKHRQYPGGQQTNEQIQTGAYTGQTQPQNIKIRFDTLSFLFLQLI